MGAKSSHFVKVPKDLNDIKQKFMFGLTKRQCVCFGIGIALGFPVFFLTRGVLGLTGGIIAMGCIAALQLYAESTRRTDCFLMRFLRT